MPIVRTEEIPIRPDASEYEKYVIKMLNQLKTNPIVIAGAQGLGVTVGKKVLEGLFVLAVERLGNKLWDGYDQWLEDLNQRKREIDPPFERPEVLSRDDQAILRLQEKHYDSQKEAMMGLIKESGVLIKTNESVWQSVRFVGKANEVTAEQVEKASEGYKNASENLSNYNVNTEDAVSKAKQVEDSLGSVADGTGDLNNNIVELSDRNKELVDSQGEVNDVVSDTRPVIDQATEGVEGYQDAVDQVDQGGGFFQGIKDGFVEFAQSVESNSELIADFFANTLSQMSQNFSDLFFNVIKGNFDDLADLAKQAFDAILKSFLDLVAAIITKELVIRITGLFDKGPRLDLDFDETNVVSLSSFRNVENEYKLAA